MHVVIGARDSAFLAVLDESLRLHLSGPESKLLDFGWYDCSMSPTCPMRLLGVRCSEVARF